MLVFPELSGIIDETVNIKTKLNKTTYPDNEKI